MSLHCVWCACFILDAHTIYSNNKLNTATATTNIAQYVPTDIPESFKLVCVGKVYPDCGFALTIIRICPIPQSIMQKQKWIEVRYINPDSQTCAGCTDSGCA